MNRTLVFIIKIKAPYSHPSKSVAFYYIGIHPTTIHSFHQKLLVVKSVRSTVAVELLNKKFSSPNRILRQSTESDYRISAAALQNYLSVKPDLMVECSEDIEESVDPILWITHGSLFFIYISKQLSSGRSSTYFQWLRGTLNLLITVISPPVPAISTFFVQKSGSDSFILLSVEWMPTVQWTVQYNAYNECLSLQ